MEPGFMYCFRNPAFPGFLMIGVSEKMSDETMRKLNDSNYSYRIPFKLDMVGGCAEKKEEVAEKKEEVAEKKEEVAKKKTPTVRKGVSMAEFFTQGQGIRHRATCPEMVAKGEEPIWEGLYDLQKNCIIYKGVSYPSLSAFAETHYKAARPDRKNHKCSGWDECEYKDGNTWLRCKTLRKTK